MSDMNENYAKATTVPVPESRMLDINRILSAKFFAGSQLSEKISVGLLF